MAYGRGQPRSTFKRMADLGRAPVTPDLARLRLLCISACGTLASSVWPGSILDDMPGGKDLDAAMLHAQSGLVGTLNSVWAEKCRFSAKAAVLEQWKRGRNCLFGRFRHVAAVGDKPMRDGMRRLLNLPAEWSARLGDADVSAMAALAASMDFDGTMELFRRLRDGRPVPALTEPQQGALRAMLDAVQARYGCPQWKAEDATVQLHLDFRCMAGGRAAQDALLAGLNGAASQKTETFRTTFLVSGVVARGTPIKLDATVRNKVVGRLLDAVPEDGEARFTSMVLEVSPREVVVKGVLSQVPRPFSLGEAEHLLGVDFGYVNTIAAAMVRVDRPLDAAWLAEVRDWTRKESKAYLETHAHPGEPVREDLFCGRDFLARVDGHARHVDRLRSEIDRVYNRMGRMRHEANCILGAASETRLDLEMDPGSDKRLADMLARFSKLMDVVGRLKLLRRGVYRAVEGLKRSWFGWLTTRLAVLCRQHKAAYVREHLTVLAVERASPDYKGRTFNKMIDNGSKGQFLRHAAAKLKWHGITELVVPSHYTSTTDVRHAVVDKGQRRGEVFTARADGRIRHADLHAAGTIALWPLLRPIGRNAALAAQ